ncbi:hypothetical protein [Erythrobacter sp. WG]|nr:hypothetical protein [Erythrobacter sp. WG]MCX9145817.1 hypothetical protein [Erythrobacter sp. WG]
MRGHGQRARAIMPPKNPEPETPAMTISTLKDLYIDQLQDLYSANR